MFLAHRLVTADLCSLCVVGICQKILLVFAELFKEYSSIILNCIVGLSSPSSPISAKHLRCYATILTSSSTMSVGLFDLIFWKFMFVLDITTDLK